MNLAVPYRGHDIAALYNKLISSAGPRTEYETTEQYEARIKRAISSEYIYAFKIESTDVHPLFKYDADAQVLIISIRTSYIATHVLHNERLVEITAAGVRIKDGSFNSSYYTGTNAFGVQARITKLEAEEYRISTEMYHDYLQERLQFSIDMTGDRAREMKPRLAVLLLCTLRPLSKTGQVVYTDSFYKSPTISEPREYLTTYKNVNVELRQVWLYDANTGEILKRYDPFRQERAKDLEVQQARAKGLEANTSEDVRKEIWREIVLAKNSANQEARRRYSNVDPSQMSYFMTLRDELEDKYLDDIGRKYGLGRLKLVDIYIEGNGKLWSLAK